MNLFTIKLLNDINGHFNRRNLIRLLGAYGKVMDLRQSPEAIDFKRGTCPSKFVINTIPKVHHHNHSDSKKVSVNLISMLEASPGREVDIEVTSTHLVMACKARGLITRTPLTGLGVTQNEIKYIAGE